MEQTNQLHVNGLIWLGLEDVAVYGSLNGGDGQYYHSPDVENSVRKYATENNMTVGDACDALNGTIWKETVSAESDGMGSMSLSIKAPLTDEAGAMFNDMHTRLITRLRQQLGLPPLPQAATDAAQ